MIESGKRADIQGLRAAAVLFVLLFHIGGWLGSGYVGVDVFFVISGYVISMAYLDRFVVGPHIIITIKFFQRRILRLLPALIVTVIGTLIFAEAILPPTENKSIAIRAGLAAMTQTSNLFFSSLGTNYWLDNLSRNPFLHTWSLGVEWQFYALFPLPFIAGAAATRYFPFLKFPSMALALLAATLLASLALFATADATEGFYGPASRFWQFALGISALLAGRHLTRLKVHAAAYVALAVALIALTTLPSAILSQRWAAAFASVITAALLTAAPSSNSLSMRLLKQPMIQSLGYASYSIYLAHWPIAVFGRLFLGEGIGCDIILIILSVALGMLLSRTVEYSLMRSARPLTASLTCLATIVIAFAISKAPSTIPALPWHASPPLISSVDGFHNFWWTEVDGGRQLYSHNASFQAGPLYRRAVPGLDMYEARAAQGSTGRSIVGIGNSYIQSSGAMLRRFAADENMDLDLFHVANCSPETESRCQRAFEYVAEKLALQRDRIEVVYVAFRGLQDSEMLVRLVNKLISKLDHPGLRTTVQGPSPDFSPYEPLQCLRFLRPCLSTQTVIINIKPLVIGEEKLASVLGKKNESLTIWSPYRSLCRDDVCLHRRDGSSIVMDSDHLSNFGQQFLYHDLRAVLKQ